MRSLFILIAFGLVAVSAADIRLENSRYETVAYIREDGRIEDPSFNLLGYIRTDTQEDWFRIEGNDFQILGYIRDNEFLNVEERKLIDITSDGRLRDTRLRNIGCIRSDGTVEGSDFRVILYTDGSHSFLRERVVAYLVFFGGLLD